MSPRKKEEWIEVREAAAIISENSGRDISPDYVRLIAHKGRIQMKPKDERQNLYLKSDVESIRVKQRRRPEISTPTPQGVDQQISKEAA